MQNDEPGVCSEFGMTGLAQTNRTLMVITLAKGGAGLYSKVLIDHTRLEVGSHCIGTFLLQCYMNVEGMRIDEAIKIKLHCTGLMRPSEAAAPQEIVLGVGSINQPHEK